jgi:hypothetical protein
MSALPPKADIPRRDLNVRFVPKADIDRPLGKAASTFAVAVIRSVELIVQPDAKDSVGEMGCDPGQKRTLKRLKPMSALPPKADIAERDRNVRFVPKAEVSRCTNGTIQLVRRQTRPLIDDVSALGRREARCQCNQQNAKCNQITPTRKSPREAAPLIRKPNYQSLRLISVRIE